MTNLTKEEMEIIRIQAERGGYTPPRQVAKLIAAIDEYERCINWTVTCSGCADQLDEAIKIYAEKERDAVLTRADECDRVADVMEFTLQGHVSAEDLRKRAALHRRRAAQTRTIPAR